MPPLRYSYVRRLADDFKHLRVAINGGLTVDGEWAHEPSFLASEADGVRRIDGVMIGRDALRRPLDDVRSVAMEWRRHSGGSRRGRLERSEAACVAMRAACDERVRLLSRAIANAARKSQSAASTGGRTSKVM